MTQAIHTPQRVKRHIPRRIATYILGISLSAFATNLSVMAALGLSAFNSASAVLGEQIGCSLGDATIIVNCSMVVLQILMLRRDYQLINLAQAVFAFLYGKIVVIIGGLLPEIVLTSLASQLVFLFFGVLFMAIGLLMIVGTELVPMPVEGFCLVLASKTKVLFHNIKIMVDCAFLLFAVVVALVAYGNLMGIGFGTVVLAFGTGWTMGKVKRFLPRWMQGWHLE